MNPPTAESYSFQGVQPIIGEVGGNYHLFDTEMGFSILSNFSYSEPEERINNELVKINNMGEETTQNLTSQPTSSKGIDSRGAGIRTNSSQPPARSEINQPPLSTTNFTNSIAQPVIKSTDTAIGATHQLDHQPPIENQPDNTQEKVEVVHSEVAHYDFNYVIEQIDQQFKRVGGTIEYWKNYLREKYQVASRLHLKDEQIMEFWHYLQGLPAKSCTY